MRWTSVISTVLLALAVLTPALPTPRADAQRPSRRVALEWPVVDGEGLASLRLGLDAAQAPGLFGAPDTVAASPVGDRRLDYEVAPGVRLEVHVLAGRIHALGLSAAGSDPPVRSPQTIRGIRLGMPVGTVAERYGGPRDGRFWYPEAGIAFNVAGPADTVASILVFRPGMPAP